MSIVADEGFLPNVLGENVAGAGALVLSVSHVRDMGARLETGEFDLVIAHDHAKPVQRLARAGVVNKGPIVFANAVTILGPRADPAGVSGARHYAEALERIAASESCWFPNDHGGLRQLQAETSGFRCEGNSGELSGAAAVMAARELGAYTLWGYHPFMRLQLEDMRAFATGDPRLLRPLRAWLVSGSARSARAQEFVSKLREPITRERIAAFRHSRDPDNQVWWPAAAITGDEVSPHR